MGARQLGHRRISRREISRPADAVRRAGHEGAHQIHRWLAVAPLARPLFPLLHPRLSRPVAAAGPGIRPLEPRAMVPGRAEARGGAGRPRGSTGTGGGPARGAPRRAATARPVVPPPPEPLRQLLRDTRWLGGDTPNYADFSALATFLWTASAARTPPLTEDDPLRAWRARRVRPVRRRPR